MGLQHFMGEPSPCTSKKSSVPPKFTFLSLFNILWEWLKVGMDAVNFIYCVNLPAPPKRYYTLLMYSLYSPSSIHSCFFSPSFCAMVPLTRASALHSLQSFYLWWSLEEVCILICLFMHLIIVLFILSHWVCIIVIIIVIEGWFFEGSSSE